MGFQWQSHCVEIATGIIASDLPKVEMLGSFTSAHTLWRLLHVTKHVVLRPIPKRWKVSFLDDAPLSRHYRHSSNVARHDHEIYHVILESGMTQSRYTLEWCAASQPILHAVRISIALANHAYF